MCHLIFSVQSLGGRSFQGFIPAYASPSLQNSDNFRSVSHSNTQGSFVRIKQKEQFSNAPFLVRQGRESATHKPLVFVTEPSKAANETISSSFMEKLSKSPQ